MNRAAKTRAHLVLFTVAVGALGSPLAAIHPNQPQGFDPERAYQRGLDQIDQIDLFSGRLSVILPLGPFAFVYNSNVWRYEIVEEDGEERIRAGADNQTTGGLGWHLGFGEVYRPQHPYNTTGRWLYVGDEGGRRVFYDTLHNDDDNAETGVWYTRDGSYLRMTKTTSFFVDVEFPDGTTRRFLTGAASDPAVFRLHKVWSRFTSADDPDVWVSHDAGDLLRTVHDRYGRQHHIHLTDEFAPRFPRAVTRVDIEAFGGQRLIYDFEYWDKWVDVSCKDDSASTPARIRAPHLKRIDNQADGTSYTFFEDGDLLYYNVCQGGIEDLPGILNGVNVPTGGKIRWVFQEYEFPPAESTSVFNSSAGVASRTLLNADGTPYGGGNATWTYKTTKLEASQTGGHPEVRTEVVNPTGDCTRHFFDAIYWKNSGTGEGWERGLPFVYTEEAAGRYLSSQVWSSNTGNGSCAGTKLRSTYLRFRRDLTPGPSAPLSDWPNLNRQVQASRIVYHDDEDRYADTDHSDFNGLGNFRRTVTTGTFRDDSTNAERRETFTHYNRVAGTYYTPGYEPPDPADPWVLGIFDYVEVSEDDAVGETTARIEYGFESDTGFLFCTRTLASGTTRGAGDVLRVVERDALGQVTDVKLFGGDLQTLATSGADCGAVPAQPAYRVTHAYQYGALKTSRPRTSQGGDGPFLTYDADLDPATGWVVNQRSEAGFTVTYDYDAAGRLLSITPEEGARATYSRVNAAGTTPGRATATLKSVTGAVLAEREVVFDAFGRIRLERRSQPGGTWSEQEVLRNARGWRTSVSQWGDPTKTTQFLDVDPFGRVETLRPPAGTGQEMRFIYQGVRRVTSEATVALEGAETYVSRSSEFDRYGRRRRVEEPSGLDGSTATTTYAYDVGGRRTEIRSGANPTQVRSFTFDNRGFLLAETHPESGTSGNGTTLYLDHDASGLTHRVVDGPHDLVSTYDLLGRPLTVRDRNQGNRMLTNLGYDTAPGRGMGKIAFATRFNYVDLPWNAQGEERVRVQQKYRYEGLGGAVSRKATKLMDWDLGTVTFHQDYVYDDLGDLSQVTYPLCSLAACGGTSAGTGRQVSYTYDQGVLTNVDGWTSQITYHPSGMWQRIYHVNGVIDHQDRDPDYSQRPARRFTTGVQPATANFDTGVMTYDGSGNLKTMGSDAFVYDEVSRLVEASLLDGDLVQSFAYDSFGNLTEKTTDEFGWVETQTYDVDPATNRLTGAVAYDAAGNLTSWEGVPFTYDTSNRLTHQAWMTYLYDPSGERVASIPNAGPGQEVVWFHLRDVGQRILSKIVFANGEWERDRDYVYAGGLLLARIEQSALGEVPYHLHLDQLGSLRLTTRGDGTQLYQHLFLPYGDEWSGGGGPTDEEPMLFTGHERDFSMDTDYMHARHYFSELGRFMSIDPERGRSAVPQRLNRYAYGLGNPLRYVDPDGREPTSFDQAHHNLAVDRCGANPHCQMISQIGSRSVWIDSYSKRYWTGLGAIFSGLGLGVTPQQIVHSMTTGAIAGGGRDILKGDLEGGIQKGAEGAYKGLLTVPLSAIANDEIRAIAKLFVLIYIYESLNGETAQGLEMGSDPLEDYYYAEGITVTATADRESGSEEDGSQGEDDAGSGQEFICGWYSCHLVPTEEAERLRDELRAIDSLRSLREFSCLLSPTTCFAGFGVPSAIGYTGSLAGLYF